jgi:hypothetical protein
MEFMADQDPAGIAERILQLANTLDGVVTLNANLVQAKRSLWAAYERKAVNQTQVEAHLCDAIASLLEAMREQGLISAPMPGTRPDA